MTRYVCGKCDYDEDAHQIAELLTLWDTRDAALRTLVEQLKSEAEAVPLRRTGDLGRRDALVRSLLTKCVDALDAILKETTP